MLADSFIYSIVCAGLSILNIYSQNATNTPFEGGSKQLAGRSNISFRTLRCFIVRAGSHHGRHHQRSTGAQLRLAWSGKEVTFFSKRGRECQMLAPLIPLPRGTARANHTHQNAVINAYRQHRTPQGWVCLGEQEKGLPHFDGLRPRRFRGRLPVGDRNWSL